MRPLMTGVTEETRNEIHLCIVLSAIAAKGSDRK